MKKILIVEDDITIREELKALLDNSGYIGMILDNFENAKKEIISLAPDLILLDINIPYLNGELLLKEIRKSSDIPIIMVTSKNSEVDEVLSISYGADDYIVKPYNPSILLLRIGAVLKRLEKSSDSVQYRDSIINFNKGIIIRNNDETLLTKNEMIILSYLYNNKERIVTRDELMTDLWNNNEYINDNALTVNISRLRSKLDGIGFKDAIETRKGQGYILL